MTLICSTYRVLTRVSKKTVWHWILSLKLKAFTRVSKKTVWHWISLKLKFLTNLIEKFYEAHVETRVSKKTAWHWISLKFKALINLVENFCEAHVDRCYDTNCTGIVKVATNYKYVQCRPSLTFWVNTYKRTLMDKCLLDLLRRILRQYGSLAVFLKISFRSLWPC